MSSSGDQNPVFNDMKLAIDITGVKTRYVLQVLINSLIGKVLSCLNCCLETEGCREDESTEVVIQSRGIFKHAKSDLQNRRVCVVEYSRREEKFSAEI